MGLMALLVSGVGDTTLVYHGVSGVFPICLTVLAVSSLCGSTRPKSFHIDSQASGTVDARHELCRLQDRSSQSCQL